MADFSWSLFSNCNAFLFFNFCKIKIKLLWNPLIEGINWQINSYLWFLHQLVFHPIDMDKDIVVLGNNDGDELL